MVELITKKNPGFNYGSKVGREYLACVWFFWCVISQYLWLYHPAWLHKICQRLKNSLVSTYFKSYKVKRVVCLVLAGDLTAFSNMFDAVFVLVMELNRLLPHSYTLVTLLTNNKLLLNIMLKGFRISERRLMLDIAFVQEDFKIHDILDIGFIRSLQNLADELIKRMHQSELRETMKRRILVSPEQWKARPGPTRKKFMVRSKRCVTQNERVMISLEAYKFAQRWLD